MKNLINDIKILVVSNMYPSKKYPHYGTFVKNTSDILVNNGFSVKEVFLTKHDNKISKLFFYIVFYIKVFVAYFVYNPNVVYVHYASHSSIPVLLAEKIIKKNLVVNVHGNDLVPVTENDYKYIKYTKRIIKIANYIVCPSKYFDGVLRNSYGINNIVIYPSGGVDVSLFKKIDRDISCKHLNLNTNNKYLGYVGRIEPGKGWDLFLNAGKRIIDRHKEYKLIIVGSGSEDNNLENLISELGITNNIVRFPVLNQKVLPYVYNSIDMLLFTSYYSESLGLVALESMSCETTTILPNKFGPVSYGVDGFNCYVYECGNVESLINVIEKAITTETTTINKEARKTALEYSSTKTKDVLVTLFSKF